MATGPVRRREHASPIARIQDEMSDLFRGLVDDLPWLGSRAGMLVPAVDVADRDDAMIVTAELPGMKKEDIEISVQGNTLCLAGEKREEIREQREGQYHSERHYGRFRREIPLPQDADPERVEASYRDGVLTVTIQKSPQARPRKIEIRGE